MCTSLKYSDNDKFKAGMATVYIYNIIRSINYLVTYNKCKQKK